MDLETSFNEMDASLHDFMTAARYDAQMLRAILSQLRLIDRSAQKIAPETRSKVVQAIFRIEDRLAIYHPHPPPIALVK